MSEKLLPEKKLDVSLIAFDLDDTLLNSEGLVSEKNASVLRKCAEKGIYVVLCSGRPEGGIMPFVNKIKLSSHECGRYIVAINGSSIFDLVKKEKIYKDNVPGHLLKAVDQEASKMGLLTEVYTPDTIYFRQKTEWTMKDVLLCKLKGEKVKDYDSFLEQGFAKMLVPGENEKLLKLEKVLNEKYGDVLNIFTSKPYFLEILPKTAGKGNALLYLTEYLGLDKKKTMAFGDGMNDESMIRMCAYGVAMKNAAGALKEKADFITEKDNNEDGVGDFIEKYVLA